MMLHTKNQGTRHCCLKKEDLVCFPNIKVKQRAKPRNLYNLETLYAKVTKYKKTPHTREPRLQPFPSRLSHTYVKYATSRNVPFKSQGYNLNKLGGGYIQNI